MNNLVVGLIRGRHELPVESYIFNEEITNVFDYKFLEDTIENFLVEKVGIEVRQAEANRLCHRIDLCYGSVNCSVCPQRH